MVVVAAVAAAVVVGTVLVVAMGAVTEAGGFSARAGVVTVAVEVTTLTAL